MNQQEGKTPEWIKRAVMEIILRGAFNWERERERVTQVLLRHLPPDRCNCADGTGECQVHGAYPPAAEERLASSTQGQRPKWFDYIRVQKRSIIGSDHEDFLISFGPLNICKPMPDERRAERLCENIKKWLQMWMEKPNEL